MVRDAIPAGSWGDIKPRQLADGRWAARVQYRRDDGTRDEKRMARTTKSELVRDMKSELAQLVRENSPGCEPIDSERTFQEVAEEWLAFDALKLEDHTKALGTHIGHTQMLRAHAYPALGARGIATITSRDVFRLYIALAEYHRPLARHVKSVIGQVLAFAINTGRRDGANPVATVKSLPRAKKPIFAPAVAELVEFRLAIVGYTNRPHRSGPRPADYALDAVDLILATGLRIGEVMGLRYGLDIFLDGDTPYCVVNGAVKEKGGTRWEPFPKTENSRRAVPLPEYAVQIIRRRQTARVLVGNEFLFHTATGNVQGPQAVHRALRNVREWAGLPAVYRPHALRKAVATQVAHVVGLEEAASVLGHAGTRVTDTYYVAPKELTYDARALLQAQWEAIVDHSAHRLSLETRAEAGEFGQFDTIADEWDELGSNQ
ncbi:site-specific integrase [Microbacterium sediminicola]|uniref:Site-specific integrase n=1 Tax=Microbacterium sediminicola TaxID=415210 RepID=A0ABP4TSD7_9MICO